MLCELQNLIACDKSHIFHGVSLVMMFLMKLNLGGML